MAPDPGFASMLVPTMAFEPQPAPGPCFSFERRDQVLGLFAKWDSLKLLGIVPETPWHSPGTTA